MSELKDYNIMDIEAMDDERLEKSESGKIQVTRVYIKSEADKVIAELKRQIEFLKVTHGSCGDCNKCADGMGKVFDENLNELKAQKAQTEDDCAYWKAKAQRERHSNYKRCLAMASTCRLRARWFGDNAFYKKEQWALQWHRRWIKIAEKFKEAK